MRADRKSQPSREPFAPQDLYMCTSLVRSFFLLSPLPMLVARAGTCTTAFFYLFLFLSHFKSDSDEYQMFRSACREDSVPKVLRDFVLCVNKSFEEHFVLVRN